MTDDKSKRRFRPLFGYALVKRIQPDKTEAGLHIPESAQDGVTRWKVVESSEGYVLNGVKIASTLQPGDEVVIVPQIATGIDPKSRQTVQREVIKTLHRPDMPEDLHFAHLGDICGCSSEERRVH